MNIKAGLQPDASHATQAGIVLRYIYASSLRAMRALRCGWDRGSAELGLLADA